MIIPAKKPDSHFLLHLNNTIFSQGNWRTGRNHQTCRLEEHRESSAGYSRHLRRTGGGRMNINTFKRGDIVMYDFGDNRGSVQNGYRPAVVLQNNDQNENSPTTVIAPTTTARKKQEMFAHF